MQHYFALRVLTDCPRCGEPVPVNGPSQKVHCASCETDLAIPDKFWSRLGETLEMDDRESDIPEMSGGENGNGASESMAWEIGGARFRVEVAHKVPQCSKCHAPLPLKELDSGPAEGVTCTQCSQRASTMVAPEWLSLLIGLARQAYVPVAASDAHGAPSVRVADSVHPIVMKCPECGGALSIHADNERVVHCQQCSADVYLPDDLWHRLHPTRVAEDWYLRLGPKDKPKKLTREEIDASIRFDETTKKLVYFAYVPVLLSYGLWGRIAFLAVKHGDLGAVSASSWPIAVSCYVVALCVSGWPLARSEKTGLFSLTMLTHVWSDFWVVLGIPIAGPAIFLKWAWELVTGDCHDPWIGNDVGFTPCFGEGIPLGLLYLLIAVVVPAVEWLALRGAH